MARLSARAGQAVNPVVRQGLFAEIQKRLGGKINDGNNRRQIDKKPQGIFPDHVEQGPVAALPFLPCVFLPRPDQAFVLIFINERPRARELALVIEPYRGRRYTPVPGLGFVIIDFAGRQKDANIIRLVIGYAIQGK